MEIGEARMTSDELTAESSRLRAAWMRHDSALLDGYLVRDVEDPRINLQSILSRSFLIDAIWPDEFTALIREEFRFSICLNFILKALKTRCPQVNRQSMLNALADGRQTCGDIRIPSYLRYAFELTSREPQELPDYISQALVGPVSDQNVWLPDSALSAFEQIWHSVLCHREASRISVLEPACGSANDYRCLHSFGVSRFLEYTGLDICDKNIANARRRFGSVDFRIEDFLASGAENKSYDYLFVHDLFEHLSGAAIELALSHVSRVTRRQACLSFFNMADIPEHVIRPQGLYHWNRVSTRRVQESLIASARSIDVVPIGAFLQDNYGCTDYHNNGAYTLIVSFDAD
jgi:hypothetical protein